MYSTGNNLFNLLSLPFYLYLFLSLKSSSTHRSLPTQKAFKIFSENLSAFRKLTFFTGRGDVCLWSRVVNFFWPPFYTQWIFHISLFHFKCWPLQGWNTDLVLITTCMYMLIWRGHKWTEFVNIFPMLIAVKCTQMFTLYTTNCNAWHWSCSVNKHILSWVLYSE